MKNLATLVIADIVLVERIRIAAFESGRPNLLFYLFIFFLKQNKNGDSFCHLETKKNLGIRTNKKKRIKQCLSSLWTPRRNEPPTFLFGHERKMAVYHSRIKSYHSHLRRFLFFCCCCCCCLFLSPPPYYYSRKFRICKKLSPMFFFLFLILLYRFWLVKLITQTRYGFLFLADYTTFP